MSNSPAPSSTPVRAIPGLLIPPRTLDTPGHWFLMRFLSKFVLSFFGWYFPMRIVGVENIPTTGPLLVVINHLSVMDIPTLGALLVQRGWHPGVTLFSIAKQEVFRKRVTGWLAPLFGMFPVYRNQVDLNAMRTMLAILKHGSTLGIAPEGTRSPTGHLQLFQPGVAKIAIQKRVPILPVGLIGVERVMPIGSRFPRRVPITAYVGQVFELSEYYGRHLSPQELERAAWDMRAQVAALLPEWMRELPPEDAEVRFGSVRSAGMTRSGDAAVER
ncbi:MAG: 1-acyl-sn-glycerol-3-phosphate acyltransferase [Chloroflexi bacterium]|nr:1-acyl-sn-glycerol-3-phosphate acyltransferase [Chloroflexota bacterium]